MRLLQIEKNLKNALQFVFVKFNYKDIVMQRFVISKDIKNIKIFVNFLNYSIKESEKQIKKINKNIGLIKLELNKYIEFKYFPEIIFLLDTHSFRIEKINNILNEVKQELEENLNDIEIEKNNLL